MAVTRDKPAPYAPTSAILDIIDRYRNRGMPSPVTAEVLERAGIPASLISRTLQALLTLDLLDEAGKPTAILEGMRLAPETEFKKRLEDWLKAAYADVFSFVDPATDDEIRFRDAFRHYLPAGQQARMVTLFQGLCAAAGLLADKPTPVRAPARPRPAAPAAVKRTAVPLAAVKLTSFANNANSLPPALAGLLASLPLEGKGWTESQRGKFLTTFTAVLDFCFPVEDEQEQEATEEIETASARKAAAAS